VPEAACVDAPDDPDSADDPDPAPDAEVAGVEFVVGARGVLLCERAAEVDFLCAVVALAP
jgi:hypothetical protein